MARALLVVATIAAVLVVLPAAAQDEEMMEEFVEEESPMVEPTPLPTVAPQATARAAPVPGDILLSDNFDDPTRAQLPLSSTAADRSQGYVGGEYEFVNGRPAVSSSQDLAIPGQFGDTSIMVDVRVLGGTSVRRGTHIACRRGTDGGGYVLAVHPDEQRVIFLRRQTGDGAPVTLFDQRSVAAVRAGEAVNRLELRCVGSTITGTINGADVVSINDGAYSRGTHALGARGSGTITRFDNLVVTQR
jgi:hypothetical protein